MLSLAFNVLFIKHSRHFFRLFSLTRLDPLGLTQIDTTNDAALAAQAGELVVFVGDSRAAAWPAPAALPGFVFVNRGINGHTAVQTSQRYDLHVAPLQPDIVIIQVGGNDLASIAVLASDEAEIIQACQENIKNLVEQSQQSGATVILSTIMPSRVPLGIDRLYWSMAAETAVTTVNQYIRSLESENVIILDAYALLADADGQLATPYAADDIHINETGYEILNQEVVQLLTQNQ
ncbi:MAG: GDSL-type esterase/lipase family protein [Chloroflexota bacterium]